PHGVEQAERHETTHEVRMQTGRARERVEIETTRSSQYERHRFFLGSNVDVLASSSKSRCSSSLSEEGTMMRTSAKKSPGSPRGFGMPRRRRRRRRPLELPAGTRTLASPAGVSVGTVAPSAASHGATGSST